MSQTVTLAGVQTRNGMRAANIIAMLTLGRIWWGDNLWILGDENVAVRIRVDAEILKLSSTGIDQGLRDRIYLMTLHCAQERCKEQPKWLKLVPEATYSVFEPGNPTYERMSTAEDASQKAIMETRS